jgi:hypothetical protein
MKSCEIETLQSLVAVLEFLDIKNDLMRCVGRSSEEPKDAAKLCAVTNKK